MENLRSGFAAVGEFVFVIGGAIGIISLLVNQLQRSQVMQAQKSNTNDRPHNIELVSGDEEAISAAQPAYINGAVIDLPEGMTLSNCPDNQRFVYTRPSSDYSNIHDGRLFASDVLNSIKTLVEIEFRNFHLTKQEKEIARMLLCFQSSKEISEAIHISEASVKYHLKNIYKKSHCSGKQKFQELIFKGIANSTHSWRSRCELEMDMKYYQVVSWNELNA